MNSLIYFNNCTSTQDELIDFLNQHYLSEDFLAVYTFNQTKGRGQYGNIWETTPEENLAYSFAIKTKNISVSDILFNYYTAILIRDFIANLTQTGVKIKWPNDLILKNKKTAQEKTVEALTDKKTIDRAAQGSMKKRNELLRRVELAHTN